MALETKMPGREATGTGNESIVAGLALFSTRPAELSKFYEKVLRTSLTHRVHADGREHWITSLGGVQFEVKALRTAGGETASDATGSEAEAGVVSRSELSFQVAGVAGAVARAVVAGAQVLQPAEAYDWGTFGVVLDPDGNRLGLFEPPTPTSTEDQA